MTEPQLRELALKYIGGQVYTVADVPEDLILSVFMPLVFMKKDQWPDDAWLPYAIMGEDDLAPRSINGHPMFFSCRFLTKIEAERLATLIEEAKAARAAFLKENDDVKSVDTTGRPGDQSGDARGARATPQRDGSDRHSRDFIPKGHRRDR